MTMMTPAVEIFFILTLTLHFSTAADYTINMAEDSIDDAFTGLNHERMLTPVLNLLNIEMHKHEVLKKEWEEFRDTGDACERALKIYTKNENNIFRELNTAMRTGRTNYASFGFKALHYLITRGIQQINSKRECTDVYRRSKDRFTIEGKTVRAGSFWSSSVSKDLTEYGKETCLKIHTCHGADITFLSFHQKEQEVLIPPYEKFEVIEEKDIMDCNVFYSLTSVGTESKMKGEIRDYLAMPKLRK